MAGGRMTWLAGLACAAMACGAAQAKDPPVLGSWTGEVQQTGGSSTYTIDMTLSGSGGTTDYPDLNCGGTLARVGSAKGYVFYTETITRGGVGDGGTCIDGTITVAPGREGLAWSWTGTDEGLVIVAWSDLRRK